MVDTPAIEEPGSPDISHENPARKGEWFGHPRQLLHIRLLDEKGDRRAAEREIFSSEFLLRRPLLDAIDNVLEEIAVSGERRALSVER